VTPGRILFALHSVGDGPLPPIEPLVQAGFAVERVRASRPLTEDDLIAKLSGISATIAGGEPYTERVFRAAPDLRLVARHGVGYDSVDVAAATRHGVAVTVTAGSNANSVADFALTLMCAVRRKLLRLDRTVREGGWGSEMVPALWQSTVGIVGLGHIGRCVARRCLGFEMRVLATEPRPDMEFVRRYDIELVALDDLCRQADIVTLHVPASPENRRLIGRERLSLMKPTAILVNTARGSLVDEPALIEALAGGRLAGAGLDVFEREPLGESLLQGLDNVVLSPHCAGKDAMSHAVTLPRCVETVLRFFRGDPLDPKDLLNPEVLRR
jgi:D-3-phosphoglycerate dehydrogenase / 2-oxoglutarate reductase